MAAFTSVVDSLKQGEDTPQTQELSTLLESQGIDINQDSQQIINSLSTIKEFKQVQTTEEVIKADPLTESQEWRERIAERQDDSEAILSELREIKELLLKHKAVPYIFSMLRDSSGDLEKVVATPHETSTIL